MYTGMYAYMYVYLGWLSSFSLPLSVRRLSIEAMKQRDVVNARLQL